MTPDLARNESPLNESTLISRLQAVDLQPTLEGRLLQLRPLQPEDYRALYAVASDPLIWEQHPEADRYQEAVFRTFFDEALRSNGALVAVDSATDEIIGSSRFHGYDADSSVMEIGWTFLARSHWGGDYNREMKRLMLRHAFELVDVIFVIGPENRRSQRAIEKLGASRVGERPDPGGRIDLIYRMTVSVFNESFGD
jgi:RimJ/RimL family protein N-acetyltransferase